MSILTKIGHGIKVVAVAIAHGFSALFGKEAAEAFGKASLELLKSALGQIVLAEVESLSNVTNLTSAEKWAKAQAAILDKAKAEGISVSTSIVNMLIELAYQFVKGNLETVQATTNGG